MPTFTTDGTDRLEARQVPERTLGVSIERTKDKNLAVANWCGGNVQANDRGVYDPKNSVITYAAPGTWIVRVAVGFVVWSKVAFLDTFEMVDDG